MAQIYVPGEPAKQVKGASGQRIKVDAVEPSGIQNGYVSTWTATGTSSGGSNSTVTKAAVASTSHFLCGILVSADYGDDYPPESIDIIVTDAGVTIIQFVITGASQALNSYYPYSGGAPVQIPFPCPIQCGENATLEVVADPEGSTAYSIDVNFWGFSDTTRCS